MKKGLLVLVILFACLFSSAVFAQSTFNFAGRVFNGTTSSALNNTNVTIEIYDFNHNFALNSTYSTLSNASGHFNLSGIPVYAGGFGYKPILIYYSGSDAAYVNKPLPEFPANMYSNLGSVNFYLKEGGTINLTAVNSTGGPVGFNYLVKDAASGMFIKEEFGATRVYNGTIHALAGRNYSIVIYPAQSAPISYALTNLSAYPNRHLNLQFNVTEQKVWVSGYVKDVNGNANFSGLHIIPYLLEPGNLLYSGAIFPYNASQWRDGGAGSTDIFNATSGFFNITLIASPSGNNFMLLAVADDVTLGNGSLGAYRNVSVPFSATPISDINLTLYNLSGSLRNITMNDALGGPDVKVSVKKVAFTLVNSSGSAITGSAFTETELDYSDLTNGPPQFTWDTEVDQSASGVFYMPLIKTHKVKRMNIFVSEQAPQKKSFTAAQIADGAETINLTSFNPGAIDGSVVQSDVFVDMIVSNSSCNVPDYLSSCSLFPSQQTMNNFNPFSIVMGGGDISFVMGRISTNLTIMYTNVDLLASGPPDVLFDANATNTSSASALGEAWKFGSKGPEIYDDVLIGMPYSSGFDPTSINVTLPLLYDDDWNVVWNTSANGTGGVGGNLTDFADFNTTWFGGMSCSTTNTAANCYISTTTGRIWLKIPHFSGVGPSVSGTALSAGQANFTITKTARNSTYYINDTVEYIINITNNGTSNLTQVNINDSFSATYLRYIASSVANTSSGNGWLYWSNVTQATPIAPNGSFALYLNMTALLNSTNVNNSITVYAYNATGASGNATTSVLVNLSVNTTDVTAPAVTLNAPANNSYTNLTSITFNCTALDTVNLTNVTFYHNASGWAANYTNSSPVNGGNHLSTKTFAVGTYLWNCYACDNSSNCAFAAANYTVTIDQTKPTISSVSSGTPTSSAATITWTTDEATNASVNYGTSAASLSYTTTSTTFTTSNSVALSSLSASTTYHYNVTSCDQSGNCNSSGGYSFITSAAATTTTTTGGSGGSASRAVEGQYAMKTWGYLAPGDPAALPITNGEIGVTKVEFTALGKIYTAVMSIKKLDALPSTVANFDKKVYRYLEVKTTNLKEDQIENAKINFKIAKTWLTENNFDKNNMALFRYVDGAWVELTTTLGEEDADYINYVAATPGFSYFLIGAKSEAAPVAEQPVVAPEETVQVTPTAPTVGEKVAEAAKSTTTWVIVVLALVVIAAVVYFFIIKKKK